MRSMVEGFFQRPKTPPPRFARSPSPGNPGEDFRRHTPFSVALPSHHSHRTEPPCG